MNASDQLLVIKPDALSLGSHAFVEHQQACDFVLGLCQTFVKTCPYPYAHASMSPVFITALEKSINECKRRAEFWEEKIEYILRISDSSACAQRLHELHDKMLLTATTTIPTKDVILKTLQALGFFQKEGVALILQEEDVEVIYRDRFESFPEHRPKLLEYLSGKEVYFITLGGEQHYSVLQWYKVLSRALLRPAMTNQPPYINLLHVADQHEREIVTALISRD